MTQRADQRWQLCLPLLSALDRTQLGCCAVWIAGQRQCKNQIIALSSSGNPDSCERSEAPAGSVSANE
jgi:hypothetical protein